CGSLGCAAAGAGVARDGDERPDQRHRLGADARDAVSMAGASGPWVVALTLAPPRPGLVQVRVEVLGSTATDRLRTVSVAGSSAGVGAFQAKLRPRGAETFGGRVRIDRRGRWTISVTVT